MYSTTDCSARETKQKQPWQRGLRWTTIQLAVAARCRLAAAAASSTLFHLFIINASDNLLLAKPKRTGRGMRGGDGTGRRTEEKKMLAKPKEAESVASLRGG
jgi:hypothetical protein